MKATSMVFEEHYSDDSGVQYAVRFDAKKQIVEFESVDRVQFPIEKIQWLIDALYRVQSELPVRSKQP